MCMQPADSELAFVSSILYNSSINIVLKYWLGSGYGGTYSDRFREALIIFNNSLLVHDIHSFFSGSTLT